MTETPVNKLILSLSLPTVVSMLVTNIDNVADTYFVGTIGTSASGAIGIIRIVGPAFTSSCVLNTILRYEGKAFYAMIGLTVGGVLHIFGDWLLVDHFGMGSAGACLSTTVSQYISMIILLVAYVQKQVQSRLNFSLTSREKYIYQRLVSNGMPSLLRQGLASVSTMVLNGCAGNFHR